MHVEESSEEYVVFGVVLFLWELVPTTFVVLFFRAQRLSQNLVGLSRLLQLERPCAGSSPRCLVHRSDFKAVRNLTFGLTPFSLTDSSRNGQ